MREMATVVVLAVILAACGVSDNGETTDDDTTSTTAPRTTSTAPEPTTSQPVDTTRGTTSTTSAEPSTTQPATASTAATTTSRETTTTKASSPLQRRDAPPEGTLDQFEWFEDGNGPCEMFPDTREPTIRFHLYPDPFVPSDEHTETSVVPVGRFMYMCLQGFGDETPTMDITGPDGTVDTRDFDGVYEAFFGGRGEAAQRYLPGDPLGEYRVIAQDGRVVGESSFALAPAGAPGIVPVQPAEPGTPPGLVEFVYGPGGTTFSFALFGFPAGQTVPLYIYVEEGTGGYRYVTEIEPAQVGGDGTTYIDFITQVDDPPGQYCLQFDPALPVCQGRFAVSGP